MEINELKYKGFSTHVYYEKESNTYYGKIENIDDLAEWFNRHVGEGDEDG